MKFLVSRTSKYGEKPCSEAIRITVENWHTRTCIDAEEFNRRFGDSEGLWESKGKNHSITKDGHITRQEEDVEKWGIEITTLKQLLDFVDKYGSVVLGQDDEHKIKEIEIYDDYRE